MVPHPIVRLPGIGVEIKLHWFSQTVSKTPDEISKKWPDVKSITTLFETDPELASKADSYINDLIEGFGREAFDQEDFPSAIRAFDVTTKGGILQSLKFQELITALPLAYDNHQRRLDIAQVIQERLQEKENALVETEQA